MWRRYWKMLRAKRGKYAANDLTTKVQILNEIMEGMLFHKEIAENYDFKKSMLAMYVQDKAAIVQSTWNLTKWYIGG